MRRTVLIVDDHAAFRESAAALLEAEGFDVVGQAADGPEAVAEAERLQPEVVLLDIQLPDIDGFAVAARLAALPEAPRVVLISSREASAYGQRLREAAARGFITKRELSGRALAALVELSDGASVPAVALAGGRGGRNRRGVGLLRPGGLGGLAAGPGDRMDADRVRPPRLVAAAGEPQRRAPDRDRIRLVRRQPHRRPGAVPAPRAADPRRNVLSIRATRTAARSRPSLRSAMALLSFRRSGRAKSPRSR